MAVPSRSQTRSTTSVLRPLLEIGAARARLRDIIHQRAFGRGEIKLASGRVSDFYFNLKPAMLDAEGAALLAQLTLDALAGERIDYVGGLEMGAVPIAGAVAQLSFMTGAPMQAFFVRKKPKEHGARLSVEGLMPGESLRGKRVVIVEDVTTTGGSAMKAVEAARDAGAEIVFVLTIVDREEGATEAFAAQALDFRAIYRASEFLSR
jgi:orotate phosphoribosyltransferase